MGVPGTCTRININGESKKNPNLSLSLSPYPLSSLLTLDLCSITATFSPSLSLYLRFLVIVAGRGWTFRRRDDFIYTAAQTTRVSVASREGARSGAGRWHGQNVERGRGRREGNSFRILYPASATRQLIHPLLPVDDIGNEDFISILGGV